MLPCPTPEQVDRLLAPPGPVVHQPAALSTQRPSGSAMLPKKSLHLPFFFSQSLAVVVRRPPRLGDVQPVVVLFQRLPAVGPEVQSNQLGRYLPDARVQGRVRDERGDDRLPPPPDPLETEVGRGPGRPRRTSPSRRGSLPLW